MVLDSRDRELKLGIGEVHLGLGLSDCWGNLGVEGEDVLLRSVNERLHLVSPDEQLLLGRLFLGCSSLEVDGLVLLLLCHGEELLDVLPSGFELPLVTRLLCPVKTLELGGDFGLHLLELVFQLLDVPGHVLVLFLLRLGRKL